MDDVVTVFGNNASSYFLTKLLSKAAAIMLAGLQINSGCGFFAISNAQAVQCTAARTIPPAAAPLTHSLGIDRTSSRARPQWVCSAVATPPVAPQHARAAEGHVALQQGLGEVGDVAPALMPWLLRLSHIRWAGYAAVGRFDGCRHDKGGQGR